MTRFFLPGPVPGSAGEVVLSGTSAHHLRDVLRARPGESVVVCDADGDEISCVVEGADAGGVRLRIVARRTSDAEPPYEAVLLQGLAKGERMDVLVQKSVELGVSRIVPFASSRCVVRLDREEGRRKAERWSRIAEEAAKQSGRSRIPVVAPPVSFEEALEIARSADLRFLPWEGEKARNLLDFRENPENRLTVSEVTETGRRPTIAFLIGPEGGFALEEVEKARAAGLSTITLGRRILRTETAGPAVLAQLSLLFEVGSGRFGTPT
jgi:16S rRNA (uracil1498-N3)-methyltransferase